jgi:hypothetical protein
MARFILDKPLRDAVDTIRSEAKRRGEITPSDVAVEAFNFAARTFETAIAEAARDSERLTPAQYAALNKCTEQTVTRAIRRGELEAERTPSGYLIAHDAVRKQKAG